MVCVLWFFESGRRPQLIVVGVCGEVVPVGVFGFLDRSKLGVLSLLGFPGCGPAGPKPRGHCVEDGAESGDVRALPGFHPGAWFVVGGGGGGDDGACDGCNVVVEPGRDVRGVSRGGDGGKGVVLQEGCDEVSGVSAHLGDGVGALVVGEASVMWMAVWSDPVGGRELHQS